MRYDAASSFETIENAHDYVTLLAVTVAEAKREIDADIKREIYGTAWRRLDALRIAAYSLDRLESHLHKSARLLNDLRSLRGLLFEQRVSRSGEASSAPRAGAPRKRPVVAA